MDYIQPFYQWWRSGNLAEPCAIFFGLIAVRTVHLPECVNIKSLGWECGLDERQRAFIFVFNHACPLNRSLHYYQVDSRGMHFWKLSLSFPWIKSRETSTVFQYEKLVSTSLQSENFMKSSKRCSVKHLHEVPSPILLNGNKVKYHRLINDLQYYFCCFSAKVNWIKRNDY